MPNRPKAPLEFVSLSFSNIRPSWPIILLVQLGFSVVKRFSGADMVICIPGFIIKIPYYLFH